MKTEQGQYKLLQSAKNIISFYNPYDRLYARAKFQQTFLLHHKSSVYDSVDLFAISDAVIKRGGYQQVTNKQRWAQVTDSLKYYPYTQQDLKKLYNQNLFEYEKRLRKEENFQRLIKFKKPKVQRFINPPKYLKGSLDYLLSNKLYKAEQEIVREYKFSFIDEYLTLRMIAFSGKYDMSKIPEVYLQKYVVVTKFLIFNSCLSIRKVDKILLKFLNLYNMDIENGKVLIIGASMQNYLLAKKLDDFGLEVTIIDLSRHSTHIEELLEIGPTMFELGKCDPFYRELYDQNFEFHKIVEEPLVFDNKLIQYNPQEIKLAQSRFFAFLHEILTDCSDNSTLFKKQFETRLYKSTFPEKQKSLIFWNLSRFFLTTRLLGDYTQIRTIRKYLDNQNLQQIITSSLMYILKNRIQYFKQKFRDHKRINVKQIPIDSLEIKNQHVYLLLKKENKPRIFDYLIYSQMENVIHALKTKELKMPQFTGQYLLNSLFVFNKLKYQTYINCLLTFKQKVWTQEMKKKSQTISIAAHPCLGDVFLIYLESIFSSPAVLAIFKKTDKIDEKLQKSELINILSSIVNPKIKQVTLKDIQTVESHYFYLKQSDIDQQVAVLNPRYRLFFNLPLMTGKYNSKLTTLLANNDYIVNSILKNTKIPLREYQQIIYQEQKLDSIVIKKKKPQEIVPVVTRNFNIERIPSNSQIPKPEIINQQIIKNVEQLFCLDHIIYKNHLNFIKGQIETKGVLHILQKCHLLEPTQPFVISQSLQIHKFGTPYIYQPNYSYLLFQNSSQRRVTELVNEFVSKRIDQSLFFVNELTYYYQTVLYIESVKSLVYIMIDELNPNVIFYHPKLSELINKIKSKLKQRERQNNKIRKAKYERVKKNHNLNCLFPYMIRKVIQNQIKSGQTFDQLLLNKIDNIQNVQLPIEPNIFYTSRLDHISGALNQILNFQRGLKKFKELKLLPLLVGYYDPLIILQKKLPKNAPYNMTKDNYTKEEQIIIQLITKYNRQINQKYNTHIPYQILKIDSNDQEYKIKRNFLSLSYPNLEQYFTFCCIKKEKQLIANKNKKNITTVTDIFYVGQGINKTQFDNPKACLDYILGKLMDHNDINSLIQYFKKFIIYELSKVNKLPNILKLLYKMDMQTKQFLNQGEISIVADKCVESKFTIEEKAEILTSINESRLDIIDGIFFHSF